MKNKPIICLDFDGVIHSYTSGWKGADVIADPPVYGAFDAIKEYAKHFDVRVFSSRSNQNGGIDAMRTWFIKHGYPSKDGINPDNITFSTEKPPAILTIDDRGYMFTGDFPSVEWVNDFQPWYKKDHMETMRDDGIDVVNGYENKI